MIDRQAYEFNKWLKRAEKEDLVQLLDLFFKCESLKVKEELLRAIRYTEDNLKVVINANREFERSSADQALHIVYP